VTTTQRLDGKTIVVTGAGRGIGRLTAIAMADLDARVAVLARSREELDETARLIRERGSEALVLPTDVGDPPLGVAGAIRRVNDDLGAVDVLVNNAAVVWPLGPSVEVM
jgi:NAD(P)-dependent dehydrogenase (short-subunit alcohol dehydrogenase family)